MIFVSAGTQLPFDRFIETVDRIADSLNEELVVQAIPGKYSPRNFKLLSTIPHNRFVDYLKQSRLVVSHAGMGTILTSMLNSKPIIVFPRQAALGEHRNDHQMATTAHFRELGYIHIATDYESLLTLMTNPGIQSLHTAGNFADDQLVGYVRDFISGKNQ